MKKRILLSLLCAAALGLCAGCGSSTDGGSGSGESSSSQVEEKTSFGVGETYEGDGVKITLNKVEENEGTQYLKPDKGNTFIVCEFTVENGSDKELLISAASFDAYADDEAISLSISASYEQGKDLSGTIAKGKKLTGIIGYELPADWKELELQYKPNLFLDKTVNFVATNA